MSHVLDAILISSGDAGFEDTLNGLRRDMMLGAGFPGYDSDEGKIVLEILRDVAQGGDSAVAQYTEKFDQVRLAAREFRVASSELKAAHRAADPELLATLRKAIGNVRSHQEAIFTGRDESFADGTGIRYTPIRRVGVCIPGAAAPLPSTVIMTAVPAQVAGVRQIAVVSPPRCEGGIHPTILAVCFELSLDEVYRIGGVQAVGALAYGTETIRKVDKIVGPGNRWVQAAKKCVAGDHVDIDSVAGPSEVLIIAGDEADPAWVAADMLSQAEHGTDSSAIVLTDSRPLAGTILAQLKSQVEQLSRGAEAMESLAGFSRIVLVENIDRAIEIADEFASEHLEVQCGPRSREVAERIRNAGAIFVGPYTPVAVGDYWAGPSHTLPTGTRAKFAGAVTSNDFVKSISVIEYSHDQFAACADDIVRLAETEGLDAHARSVKIRQKK